MNQKHFLIYYKHGTDTFIITEPRPWARENQHHFPGFNFVNKNPDNHPTTEEVEEFPINNYGFQVSESQNPPIKVLFNFNPDIDL